MTRFLGNTSQETSSARRPALDFPPASSPSSPFPPLTDIIDLTIGEDTPMLGVVEEGDKEEEDSVSFTSKGKGTESGTGASDPARLSALKRPRPRLSSSPKDEPFLKRRSPPSKLGPSVILGYKAAFLNVSPPLTTVGGCPPQAHPFLTLSSPERAIWNDPYLRCAIVRFPEARSEVKFRLWAITSHLDLAQLVLHAFERHLPMVLPVRLDQAIIFKKVNYSEMEMRAFYYTPGFITPPITYNADERQLWNNYLAAVADLLARPHARALVFRGGLVSRLVQALAPKQFFDGLLYGPSAQVTRYNKGFTDPEAGTVEDEVSQYDVSVILGVTTTPPGKGTSGTWSIWPSGRLFEEEFRGWDGEWNAACERWFMDSWSRREGRAFVSSGREWKHNLRRVIVEGLPRDVKRVAPEAWSTALERLRADMVEVWPANNCLSDIRLPIE